MDHEHLGIVLHIGSALLAGSLIGLERSYHGRPAGFRTHALVCTASAILMLVTSYQWQWLGNAPMDTIRTDPTRMAQGIMTGIGFLGAGVIFKEGVTVRGLTTAASIWMTAALGILYGVGFYFPAVLATLAALGILAVFRWLENWFPNQFYAQCMLRFAHDKAPTEAEVKERLGEHGFRYVTMSYALVDRGTMFEYRTVIMAPRKSDATRLADSLRRMDDLLEFRISPTGH